MKLGICSNIDNAAAFHRVGGDYLEVGVQRFLVPLEGDDAFSQSLRAVEACPLPITAANGFLPGSLRSTGPETHHDAICDYAATAFARAKMIGIRHIVFGSGGSRELPEGFGVDEANNQFVELLKRLGPIAAEYGVVVVIEPLRRHECNFINTIAEGAAITRQVDHPNIQLLADLYHMMQNGEAADAIVEAGPLIRHAHLAEHDNRTCPGIEGTDFVPFFKAFKQIGYTGDISIEGHWPNGIEADGAKAVAVFREQRTAAGWE